MGTKHFWCFFCKCSIIPTFVWKIFTHLNMHWPKCPVHMKNLIIFFGTVTFVINLFIYEAREYSLVPIGFLTAQFLQKGWWHLMMVEIWWCFSLLLSWRKEGVKRNDVDWSYHCFSFFKQALQRNTTSLLPSQQRLHKLCFLQKQACQKPCWDQARLSSLLKKTRRGRPGW